jgi:hypothetical protein
MSATSRLAAAPSGFRLISATSKRTGLLSTTTSNPDDERPEIQIIWIVSKVPYFFNAGYLDKASEPSIYRMKSGREILIKWRRNS